MVEISRVKIKAKQKCGSFTSKGFPCKKDALIGGYCITCWMRNYHQDSEEKKIAIMDRIEKINGD